MLPLDRSLLRTAEAVLSTLVLLVVTLMVTNFSYYPSWPTLGPVPIDPELVVPGLLGLVVLLGAVVDGLSVESVVVGAFGGFTLLLAIASLHSLYTATAGCSFGGGILTLTAGVPLSVLVLGRIAVSKVVHHRA